MDTFPPDLIDAQLSPLAGLLGDDTQGFSERTRAALERWPDVPALFGWLELDPRGRWWLGGGLIENPNIVQTINRHYRADAQGRWYFQNGPQRGFVKLHTAPLVLATTADGAGLQAHTGRPVSRFEGLYFDEQGGLWAATDLGPAVFGPEALVWALEHLAAGVAPGGAAAELSEGDLTSAQALPDGAPTRLTLVLDAAEPALSVPVTRLDAARAPAVLGFVTDPRPDLAAGEPPVEACLPARGAP